MRGLDQDAIRIQNMTRLWEALIEYKQATRQTLAEATGQSLMTVSNLVEVLKANGALKKFSAEKAAPHMPGRKAEILQPDSENLCFPVIDLTGRHFSCVMLSSGREHLCPDIRTAYDSQKSYNDNLSIFLNTVKKSLANELSGRRVPGTAVITPGPYHIERDAVYNQRIPELNMLPVKQILRTHLGEMNYYVEEDVKFAVRNFLPLHMKRDGAVLYYLYIGEGVGGAILHNGNMLRGGNAVAGDAGQLPAPGGGNYEKRLCLSTFAEQLGIAPDNKDEDTLLLAVKETFTKNPALYERAIEASALECAQMLNTIRWMLDPVTIVIECRYAYFSQQHFFNKISEELIKRTLPVQPALPELVAAPEKEKSVLIGAARILNTEWIRRMVAEY